MTEREATHTRRRRGATTRVSICLAYDDSNVRISRQRAELRPHGEIDSRRRLADLSSYLSCEITRSRRDAFNDKEKSAWKRAWLGVGR